MGRCFDIFMESHLSSEKPAEVEKWWAKPYRILKASRYTGDGGRRNLIVGVVSIVGLGLYLWTAGFLVTHPQADCKAKSIARVLLVLWTIIPPAWFWAEYQLIWQTADEDKRGDFDKFKHSQELSRNIWLAFVGLLLALYFKA